MLHGKGLWARGTRELARAIQIAPQMGITHIIYKVGQGSEYYPGAAQAVQKITGAGLVPFAWTWLLLDDPQAEAQVTVRAFQDGFQGFVFDTEADRCRNRFGEATQLGQYLRVAGLDLNRLYNCSFPNISQHRDLPYEQMNEYCQGGLMPMSYGTYFGPGSTVPPDQQAGRVIDEWTYGHYAYWCRRWGYSPPMCPVLGPYHDEYGNVRMSPDEFQIWLDRLAAHGPTFFSVFTAAVINDDIMPLIRAFPLGEGVTPVPTGIQVEVVSPEVGYLNVRPVPSTERPPITRVDDEDLLESLEPEADTRAKVGQEDQWLHVRTRTGIKGYVAAWYLCLPEEAIKAGVKMDVVSPEVGYLNVRPGPSTTRPPITRVDDGTVLESLEPEEDTWAKVGQEGQWLHVRTPDSIEGYVAAWYLRPSTPRLVSFGVLSAEAIPPETEVEVVSPEFGFLNVRPRPSTARPPIAQVDDGAVLKALEPEANVRAKVGQEDQWLYVRTPDNIKGHVAAWYLRLPEEAVAAGIQMDVVSPEVGYLNVRPSPSTARPPITRVDDGTVLESLEPEEDTRAKVGQENQWLYVRTPDNIEGYVAASYLCLHEEGKGEAEVGGPISHLVVHSATGLNVRRTAGTDIPPIWHVVDRTTLEVRKDPKKVGAKVGKDQWIKVRTPSLHEGYVNGLYVQDKRLADKRKPVDDAALPAGESAWIFGFHAAGATTPADFRFLFQGKNKTGWVLFTEAIGADPHHGGGHDYSPWSQDGYGVIVRLNHGYEPGGTLPVRARYASFAQACACYVRDSRGCHIWIIGNEQNNVREHPGGAEDPSEHITPQMYAEAFNLARQRIKEIQPEAIVVPGSVDPYNTYPWAKMGGRRNRPLEYFKEMLSHIDDLDGIALHTYTHWLDAGLITKPTVFQDEFLQPGTPHEHYYDFLAYRPFAEAIPDKWRNRPIYITESNHWLALEHQPRNRHEEGKVGWVNKDKGWVQAAYAEINRWNSTPHAPQIHCLLLYRWTGDAWALERMGEIHKDLKKALDHDYRWRR